VVSDLTKEAVTFGETWTDEAISKCWGQLSSHLKQRGFFQNTFLVASSSLHSPPAANTVCMISWNWVNTPRLGHRIQEDFITSWVSWREVQLKRRLAFSPVYCSVKPGPWPFLFIYSDSPSPCIPICMCIVNTGSSL